MKHDIALAEWIDYLDGLLSRTARERIDAHLRSCPACRRTCARMRNMESALRQAGMQLTRREQLDMRQALGAILSAICGTEMSNRVWRAAGRLALEDFASTGRVADAAARLRHLCSITSELCGRAAARLIWDFGNKLLTNSQPNGLGDAAIAGAL